MDPASLFSYVKFKYVRLTDSRQRRDNQAAAFSAAYR